jgi:histidinol-phosphatase (PHP family)
MKYLQNLHTHSTYCDGRDTLEEMVQRAIELNFDSIGFSGHSFMHWAPTRSMSLAGTEQYKKEIGQLKEKYKGQIDIYRGLELDIYSEVELVDYDYVIGGAHYFLINGEYVGFDRSRDEVGLVIRKHFGGDGFKYAQAYYGLLARLADFSKVDIVGHFDLITKWAEKENFFDQNDPRYRSIVMETLEALAKKIPLFEINTGAVSRGYRTTPYMTTFILKALKEMGAGITISSDCHDRRYLTQSFDDALEMLRTCGYKEVYHLTPKGFAPMAITD